jgi:hypothetical protein
MSNQTTPNSSIGANASGNAAGAAQSGTTGSVVENLLKEFDSQSGSQPAPQTTATPDPVYEFAKAEMQAKQATAYENDVKAAVAHLKVSDETKDLPDRLALGFLHALANEDAEFAQAWQNRQARPGAWKDALNKAQREWLEEVKKLPTSKVRTEVEAAAAAVLGQTNTPSDFRAKSPDELRKMSLRELQAYGNSMPRRKG